MESNHPLAANPPWSEVANFSRHALFVCFSCSGLRYAWHGFPHYVIALLVFSPQTPASADILSEGSRMPYHPT